MSDYIKREDATAYPILPKEHRAYQTSNLDDAYELGWTDLQNFIEALPSADVVEVVRCKDCEWGTDQKTGKINHIICELEHLLLQDIDYCSYGERRTNGTNA